MLKSTFILFVIYFTATQGYERKGYPEYKYQKNLGGWMKLHDRPATWEVADETCKQEGGLLVASQFNEVDETLIKIVKESNKSIEFLYIGSVTVTAPTKENEEVVSINPPRVDCLVIFANNATKKSVDCSEEHPFICYAPMEEADCDVHEWGQDREGWPGYNRCSDIDGWVKVHPGPNDFDEAKKTCEEEGGELVDPNDEKFKKIALKLIKANSTAENPLLIFGKTKVTHPHGGFVEVDGKKKFVKDLKPYCTILYPNGTINHQVDCDTKVGFICYVPYPIEITCDNDYQLENSTGRCFKIHSIGKTWSESRKHCQNDGGDLAVITSPEVANKLTDMYSNYDGYFETYHPWALFVGILEKTVGSWTTINGETPKEAGYEVWAAGNPGNKQSENPNYKGVRQTCGCMNMQGKYVNCWCEMKHAYICEKNSTVKKGNSMIRHFKHIFKNFSVSLNNIHVASRLATIFQQ